MGSHKSVWMCSNKVVDLVAGNFEVVGRNVEGGDSWDVV
jgi:hypothetical protein